MNRAPTKPKRNPDGGLVQVNFRASLSAWREIMSPRIGGAPSLPPQIDTDKSVEANAKTDVQAEPERQAEQGRSKSISAQHKSSQLAEHSMAGQVMLFQLKNKVSPKSEERQSLGSLIHREIADGDSEIFQKTTDTTKPLQAGSKGYPVKSAQKEINKWRVANGRAPIAEDGEFGDKTATAIRDFQKATGLDRDSKIGGNTRDRLALENNSKFQALSPETKKQVRDQMNGYKNDPAARKNLYELATDPDFAKLSRAGQQEALRGLAIARQSDANLKNVKQEVRDRTALEQNSNFQKLPASTQKEVMEKMERYALEPRQREQLMKIATEPGFAKLSESNQDQVLKTLAKNPADPEYAAHLKKLVGSESFQKLDDANKSRTLRLLGDHPLNTRYNNQLVDLVAHKNFGKMSLVDQSKTLNLFENTTMNGRTALLDVMKRNISGTPALMTKTIGGSATLLDQLDRINSSNLSPRVLDARGNAVNKKQVVEALLQEVANPNRHIDQSNRGTCTCTSMTYNLALSQPAEYARIVTDLATTGQSRLAGGATIQPPADAFRGDNSSRSVGERLFQSALMNFGQNGNYQNSTRKSPNDPLIDTGGLSLDQEIKVLSALHGKSYKSMINLQPVNIAIPTVDMSRYDAVERTKRELAEGRGPIHAALRWGNGAHAVEITKFENGRFYIRNPWGGNVPGVTRGVGIDYQRHQNPPRRVEDAANGIESISEMDYRLYLRSIIVER